VGPRQCVRDEPEHPTRRLTLRHHTSTGARARIGPSVSSFDRESCRSSGRG
jgi:hypothetical protein